MMSKKDIACLLIKIKQCSVSLGYSIAVKEPLGYNVKELEVKLAYLNTLRRMVETHSCGCNKKIIKGYIKNCAGKILPSKNNPLLLNKSVNNDCCVDLCEVEAKLGSICINC